MSGRATTVAPDPVSVPGAVPPVELDHLADAAGAIGRPMRADARRNRDAVLAAASQLFAEQGVDAPLEQVARRAEVGIGTLYRHFPTRDALVAGVYLREVDLLCDDVEQLLRQYPADVALASWMQRFVRYVATKKGMAVALKSVVGADSELFTRSRERIYAAMDQLITAAVAADAIRPDVDPDDLMRAMSGFCLVTDQPDWQDRAARLVDLLVDGLRFRPG
ncbi:MAG: TetR/AcrR family transcriptional regulator [Actinobacteria bacterium]|nr:TetR/AcrR family transcriptional regulator [Actinomycetota bacterium]